MAKRRKNKVVQIKNVYRSPENYIRTQARSLPVTRCFVSGTWREVGMSSVIVVRQHKTGRLTAGVLLIDMYCLGVKDADYMFNITEEELQDVIDMSPGMEECEYVLAHNMIFGALAYAKDYGFEPHKDFEIARYILEDDDENIELIELDYGRHGAPCYIYGPYDDDATVKRNIATLTRTAGEGNFSVIDKGKDPGDDEWDDDDDDPDDDEWGDSIEEGHYDNGDDLDEEYDADGRSDSWYNAMLRMARAVSKEYDELIRAPEARAFAENNPIGASYRLTSKIINLACDIFDDAEQEAVYERLKTTVFETHDYKTAIKELKQLIKKYPGKLNFYVLLHYTYMQNLQDNEAENVLIKNYETFSDNLACMIDYANLLMDKNRYNEVPAVFKGQRDLNDLYPDQKMFNRPLTMSFYQTMCRYNMENGDIDKADLYMNALYKKKLVADYGRMWLKGLITRLTDMKMDAIVAFENKDEQ